MNILVSVVKAEFAFFKIKLTQLNCFEPVAIHLH